VELETKVQKLQDELTMSYKRNSDNAQMMIEINRRMKEIEEDSAKKIAEIALVKEKLSDSEALCKKLQSAVDEKDDTLAVLRDEFQAREDKLKALEQRNLKLEGENLQLVERWILKMNEEASKMNDANVFCQQMLEASHKLGTGGGTVETTSVGIGKGTVGGVGGVGGVGRLDSGPSLLDRSTCLPAKLKRKLTAHTGEVNALAFSSTGMLLATGSTDKTVRLWDLTTGSQKSMLMGAVQSVMCVRFSPNDEFVLGASNDNAARLWTVQTSRIGHTLTGHVGKVLSGVFSFDSSKVVTGSHDRSLKVWDLSKGYCIRTIFCASSCNDLCLVQDGVAICSGHVDHHVRFWDVKTGDAVRDVSGIHENQITSVCLSPDGRSVLTNCRDNTLKVIDVRTYEVQSTFRADEYRNGLNWTRACFSPDGHYIAAGSQDGSIFIWNALNNKLERMLSDVHSSPVSCCSWSPSGAQFASAGDRDKLVVLWDP